MGINIDAKRLAVYMVSEAMRQEENLYGYPSQTQKALGGLTSVYDVCTKLEEGQTSAKAPLGTLCDLFNSLYPKNDNARDGMDWRLINPALNTLAKLNLTGEDLPRLYTDVCSEDLGKFLTLLIAMDNELEQTQKFFPDPKHKGLLLNPCVLFEQEWDSMGQQVQDIVDARLNHGNAVPTNFEGM